MKNLFVGIASLVFFGLAVSPVMAGPYFFVQGPSGVYPGGDFRYNLYVETDNSVLTAAQTVVQFNTNVIVPSSITNLASVCSFWAPPDPSSGLPAKSTPYITSDKIVVSCGFSNPGYTSSGTSGGLVIGFNVRTASGLATNTGTNITLDASNTKFLYIDSTIAAGTLPSTSLTAYHASGSGIPTPTPTSPPNVATSTFGTSDFELVEINGSSGTSSRTQTLTVGQTQTVDTLTQNDVVSSVDSLDNSIPPPPNDLEPRAPVTPFRIPPTPSADQLDAEGDVLSVQSLRELLLPGQSEADSRVVIINLLTTLTFLILLAILVWRLIIVTRMNKIRYRHMQDMLTGEISVIESKLGDSIDEGELAESLERLKRDLEKP